MPLLEAALETSIRDVLEEVLGVSRQYFQQIQKTKDGSRDSKDLTLKELPP